MKGKGSYTGAVAVIAVAIMVAVSYGMASAGEAQKGENRARAIIETKWELQNTRHLVGKVFADAIADNTDMAACSYGDVLDLINKVGDGTTSGYIYESINGNDDVLPGCKALNPIVDPTSTANSSKITFDISCTKDAGGIGIDYTIRELSFDKQAYYDNSDGCLVDVEDNKSLACDVDRIVGGGCGS